MTAIVKIHILIYGLLFCRSVYSFRDPGFEQIRFERTAFRGVEGALIYHDAIVLHGLTESVCAIRGGEIRYAEIGSYLGLSVTIVAHACARGNIFAHDIFPLAADELPVDSLAPPDAKNLLVRFWDGIRRNDLEGRVIPMRGKSQETLHVHAPESLDLAFVDGDHSFLGALADLRLMWSKIRPGGVMLAHDCNKWGNDGTEGDKNPTREAAIKFSEEVNSMMFELDKTWGMVAFFKGDDETSLLNNQVFRQSFHSR